MKEYEKMPGKNLGREDMRDRGMERERRDGGRMEESGGGWRLRWRLWWEPRA